MKAESRAEMGTLFLRHFRFPWQPFFGELREVDFWGQRIELHTCAKFREAGIGIVEIRSWG